MTLAFTGDSIIQRRLMSRTGAKVLDVCLHSRTAFEEPERKRHLLRTWVAAPNSRAQSPAMSTIYRDQSAGVVRGGIPSRTGKLIFVTAGSLK